MQNSRDMKRVRVHLQCVGIMCSLSLVSPISLCVCLCVRRLVLLLPLSPANKPEEDRMNQFIALCLPVAIAITSITVSSLSDKLTIFEY